MAGIYHPWLVHGRPLPRCLVDDWHPLLFARGHAEPGNFVRGRCARVGLSIDNPRPATVPGVWGPVGYPPASISSGGSKRPPSTARLTPTTPSATDYRHCIDYRAQQPIHKPTNPAYPYKDRKLEREGRQAERTHSRSYSPPLAARCGLAEQRCRLSTAEHDPAAPQPRGDGDAAHRDRGRFILQQERQRRETAGATAGAEAKVGALGLQMAESLQRAAMGPAALYSVEWFGPGPKCISHPRRWLKA